MKKDIKITPHAKKRFKQRTGLPKKILEKKVRIAFEEGKSNESLKGTIKRYVNRIIGKHPEIKYPNVRISIGFVWIFVGKTLVTLYPIPGHLSKYLH
jgi:hypothetical protein